MREQKQAEAAALKAERAALRERLAHYESKVLQSDRAGGKSLIEKAAEREAALKQKQWELECRCARGAGRPVCCCTAIHARCTCAHCNYVYHCNA
jgi:hypothetical protein